MFPTLKLLEEVSIPVREREILFIDFYIPLLNRAIEVHGEQHFKFVKHFHGDQLSFAKAKKRDADKSKWCELNSISLVSLRFDEDDDEWRQKIASGTD